MMDDIEKPWSSRPMTITIFDKGHTMHVSSVDHWIEERKGLLRTGRKIVEAYDGKPQSLYPQHGKMVAIVRRLAEIKVIFETFNGERDRYADRNIDNLVSFFNDPKNAEGVDG